MTLLTTTEAGYKTTGEDKHPAIDDVFVFICRRKPTKCGVVHQAPEALMGYSRKNPHPYDGRHAGKSHQRVGGGGLTAQKIQIGVGFLT